MKKINYLIMALILMFSISFEVKADADVDCLTASGKHQCTLSGDVVISNPIDVYGEIELDLNGHIITVQEGTPKIAGGLIRVGRGAKLTIKDTVGNGKITTGTEDVYGAVQVTIPGEAAEGAVATLVVESGTLEGEYYGIVGNGGRHNTSITVNGGTIVGLSDGTGIYHPQDGTLIINGGTVRGATGIEMRAGSLTVNGGVIEGAGVPTSVTPNGSGSTTEGAGIAIAQHTTLKNISVNIKNGTIRGFSALYESNPQHNANVADQVNVSVTGGNFEAINNGTQVVYSEDLTDFIIRGTFNKALNADYVSETAEIEESNGSYAVVPNNYDEIEADGNVIIDTTYESSAYVAPIETYDVDLSWDDLHWVFVYEGEVSNPDRQVWLNKEDYDALRSNLEPITSNEFNGEILDSINTLPRPDVSIVVENHSAFAVSVLGSIEQKSNENYTNSALLQIGVELPENTVYGSEATISTLQTNANASLLVKPTATRFVNDDGVPANVTGEVKLNFTKAN